MTENLPTIAQAKAMAREWRAARKQAGESLRHGAALEHVARQLGFRDWNLCAAMLSQAEAQRYQPGQVVRGRYLSQPFSARVLRATAVEGRVGWVRLELDLEVPVDVVTSQRFSSFRRRVNGVIGPEGFSREQTSDGQPHLVIDP